MPDGGLEPDTASGAASSTLMSIATCSGAQMILHASWSRRLVSYRDRASVGRRAAVALIHPVRQNLRHGCNHLSTGIGPNRA